MTTVSQRSQIKSSFIPAALTGICPFCGTAGTGPDSVCTRCGTQDSSASRERAKSTVGPWQVLDPNHPAAQGVNFETLRSWINDGKVVATSVVRGPTTAQLWKPAGKVKGLSREFGVCYSCDSRIDRTAALCPNCNRSQTLPFDPDMLIDATSPVPLPAAASPLSTQTWIEETPVRSEVPPTAAAVTTTRPARKVFKRDLLLTPGDLAKVFQLNAGPIARIDYRPRRNHRQVMRKVGLRVTLVALLAGATAAAVHESIATGPLAWQWIRHTLLGESSHTTVATSSPAAGPIAPSSKPTASDPSALAVPKPDAANPAPAMAASPKPVGTDSSALATSKPRAAAIEPSAFAASKPLMTAEPAVAAPAPKVSPRPETTAAVAAARLTPSTPEADPADASPEQAIHDLWTQGLAAESQRRFAVAVDRYEQIVSYPNTYWPATLNVRLGLARQEVGGSR